MKMQNYLSSAIFYDVVEAWFCRVESHHVICIVKSTCLADRWVVALPCHVHMYIRFEDSMRFLLADAISLVMLVFFSSSWISTKSTAISAGIWGYLPATQARQDSDQCATSLNLTSPPEIIPEVSSPRQKSCKSVSISNNYYLYCVLPSWLSGIHVLFECKIPWFQRHPGYYNDLVMNVSSRKYCWENAG